MIRCRQIFACLLALLCAFGRQANAEPVSDIREFFSADGRQVTPASYPTDETSRQFLRVQTAVGVNRFFHRRELTPTDDQPVVRMNRDTYYSIAVVDVTDGATITLPNVPAGKYLSMQPVTEDHRTQRMS